MDDYAIRTLPLTDGLTDDLKGWLRAVSLGFTQGDWPGEGMGRWFDQQLRDASTVTAVYPRQPASVLAPHTPVGTFLALTKTLNTGHGHLEPTHLISDVTVRATHRRRGILREVMTEDLRRAKAEGSALAALTVSEATIYGRFGFGITAQRRAIELDKRRATLPAPAEQRIEIADAASSAELLAESFARFHATTRGSVDRLAFYDDILTGAWDYEKGGPDRGVRVAFHLDEGGRPDGHVVYNVEDDEMKVRDLIAADPGVELALWHFVCSVDLVDKITFGRLAPTSPLPWALGDARALKTKGLSDALWLRVLDVERALSVRGWDADGSVAFAVADPLGHASGAWRLDVEGSAAHLTALDAAPDLTLDVRALGSLYLGAADARALAAAGQIEGPAEAVGRLAQLFRTDQPPYCATGF